jgi:L-asparagine transporter-like permease
MSLLPRPNRDAVDNIIFLKRQQWVATNYALLVYAAIFVISAQYFQRTDFARNTLGIVAIVAFCIHWYMMALFQSAIEKFRSRLYWIYRTYFNGEEQSPAGFASRVKCTPWGGQVGDPRIG